MASFDDDPKNFELYLVQHSESKLYWDAKGFNQKNKNKAILVDYRVMKTLKHEHIHITSKIILADWRDDNSWAHLVPAKKCIS